MFETVPSAVTSAVFGGFGGIVLGLAARLTNFCTLAAIEDGLYSQDKRRLRMWALAAALSAIAVAFLDAGGVIDFSQSLYHGLNLNPLAWVIGGLLFGYGMALSGTCAFGTLARIGGGDLRALFGFFILAVAAYMAVSGPTAELRELLIKPAELDPSISAKTIPDMLGLGTTGTLLLTLALAVAVIIWCLVDQRFRCSMRHILGAFAVATAIVSGWIGTGWVAQDAFDPVPLGSHTYSYPIGQTLLYLMTISSSQLSFGIGATLGVVVGALAGALIKSEFRWEGADDAIEMRRHLAGTFLMGTGGIYAGGCTIGQGMTAASLLTLSAPVVMMSIVIGVWLGLMSLMDTGPLSRLFGRNG